MVKAAIEASALISSTIPVPGARPLGRARSEAAVGRLQSSVTKPLTAGPGSNAPDGRRGRERRGEEGAAASRGPPCIDREGKCISGSGKDGQDEQRAQHRAGTLLRCWYRGAAPALPHSVTSSY